VTFPISARSPRRSAGLRALRSTEELGAAIGRPWRARTVAMRSDPGLEPTVCTAGQLAPDESRTPGDHAAGRHGAILEPRGAERQHVGAHDETSRDPDVLPRREQTMTLPQNRPDYRRLARNRRGDRGRACRSRRAGDSAVASGARPGGSGVGRPFIAAHHETSWTFW